MCAKCEETKLRVAIKRLQKAYLELYLTALAAKYDLELIERGPSYDDYHVTDIHL